LLGSYALLCLGGAALTWILQYFDGRLIGGVSVWLKPTKFFLSISFFAATAAWFFAYIRAERRSGLLMKITVATLILSASYELFWITWQGAHGLGSHFNFDTQLYALMYALMGVGATLLVGTTLPLAWEIARRPSEGLNPAYRLAVVLGLLLTFALGGSLGGYISASGGSAVGLHARELPLFAWNQTGGDLRVAHFFGMHAQQALPFSVIVLGADGLPGQRVTVVITAMLYAALTITLWFGARAGQPFLPL
jgi:hypothetical protein